MATDREPRFRLRPRKPVVRSERAPWVPALKIMLHYARMSRIARRRSTSSRPTRVRPYFQRCAVRVTYARNSTRGQWRAHGRYMARDSATREHDSHEPVQKWCGVFGTKSTTRRSRISRRAGPIDKSVHTTPKRMPNLEVPPCSMPTERQRRRRRSAGSLSSSSLHHSVYTGPVPSHDTLIAEQTTFRFDSCGSQSLRVLVVDAGDEAGEPLLGTIARPCRVRIPVRA